MLFVGMADGCWFSITIGEGDFRINEVSEPEIEHLAEICDTYAYPTFISARLNDFLGKPITGIFSYEMNGKIEGVSIGLFVECGASGFTIWEREENCLEIYLGKPDSLLQIATLQRGLVTLSPSCTPKRGLMVCGI